MPANVTMADFDADFHGAKYRTVSQDALEGPALQIVLDLAQDPAALVRARDLSDRWDLPALDAAVLEIDAHPQFLAACGGGKPSRRLRQAVGVAYKLIMDRHFDYAPKYLPSGDPDEGRLRSHSRFFTKARKYGPKRKQP